MRVLVLGGTAPLGHLIAAHARDGGHEVACLARGDSGTPPEGCVWVRADRTDGAPAYADLAGTWDAVFEVSWRPTWVADALAALGERAAHWTYVSSGSVYADSDTPGADEAADLLPPLPPGADEGATETYGEAKVACENAVRAARSEAPWHVSRAGLLAGPGDRSDRVGYWPARFAAPSGDAGEVLVPAAPDAACQFLDFRDYAAFLVGAASAGVTGVRNAVGEGTSLQEVLAIAARVAGHAGPVVAADPQWLADQGVAYWSGPESLPLWLPEGHSGFGARSDEAAVDSGLTRRPIEETLADTLDDERARGLDRERKAGLSRRRERELLAELACSWPGSR